MAAIRIGDQIIQCPYCKDSVRIGEYLEHQERCQFLLGEAAEIVRDHVEAKQANIPTR